MKKLDSDIKVWLLFSAVFVLLGLSAVWAWHTFISTPPYVDSERYPIRGIDVSAHNGMMNLDAAAEDGIKFVFIKATEGETFRDENFKLNYSKAGHAGLKRGAYHYFRFDKDGVLQAINLLDAVKGLEPELGLVIDVEDAANPATDPDTVITRLMQMTDYLILKGHRVMFYTNIRGYEKYLMEEFPGYLLWICSFSENPINADWTFWQYNHRGKVKGIKGNVDLNVFIGDEKDWEKYLNY